MDPVVPKQVEEVKSKFNQIKYQYLAVFIVNLVTFCHGFNFGWVSPSIQILQSENRPLPTGPITTQQTMLLGVLSPVGGLIGTIMFSMLSHYLGRINSISLLAFPNMAFLVILICSNTIEALLIGRLIAGLSLGGMYVCIPLFIAEISDKRIRGFLFLFSSIINNCGVLTAFICGAFMDYDKIPYVAIWIPAIFLVAMMALPEPASNLLRQNKIESAKKSIQFYNNGNNADNNGFDTDAELKKLKEMVNEGVAMRKQSSFKLILKQDALKRMASGLCLILIVVLSDTYTFETYASHVFKESNAKFDANLSAIIMSILQIFGTYISSMLIDSWGRRKLFGLSSVLSGIALIVFGTFSYLNNRGIDMTSLYWLPVTSVSFFIFVNSAGMRPIPIVYTTEILPENVRNIGTTMCMLFLIICTIVSVGTLPILMKVIGLHAVMWIFSGICFLGAIFCLFFMEETKGKNLNESQTLSSTQAK